MFYHYTVRSGSADVMAAKLDHKLIAKTPLALTTLHLVILVAQLLATEVCSAEGITEGTGEGRSSDVCPMGVDKKACIVLLQQAGRTYRAEVDAEEDKKPVDVATVVGDGISKVAAAEKVVATDPKVVAAEEAVAKNPKVAEAAKAVEKAAEKIVDAADAVAKDPEKLKVVEKLSEEVAAVLVRGLSDLAATISAEPKIKKAQRQIQDVLAKAGRAIYTFATRSSDVKAAEDALTKAYAIDEKIVESLMNDPKVVRALKKLQPAVMAGIASLQKMAENPKVDAAVEAWIKAEIAVALGQGSAEEAAKLSERVEAMMKPVGKELEKLEAPLMDTGRAAEGALNSDAVKKLIAAEETEGEKAYTAATKAVDSAGKDAALTKALSDITVLEGSLEKEAEKALTDGSYFAKPEKMLKIVAGMQQKIATAVIEGVEELEVTDAASAVAEAVGAVAAAGSAVADDPKVAKAAEATGKDLAKAAAAKSS